MPIHFENKRLKTRSNYWKVAKCPPATYPPHARFPHAHAQRRMKAKGLARWRAFSLGNMLVVYWLHASPCQGHTESSRPI